MKSSNPNLITPLAAQPHSTRSPTRPTSAPTSRLILKFQGPSTVTFYTKRPDLYFSERFCINPRKFSSDLGCACSCVEFQRGSSSSALHQAAARIGVTRRPTTMDVDSQPMMEETILVGDDLMLGPPSPLIPPEIASHVLQGVNLCDGILRNLFLCLQINDIEPFCQDELVLYRQCAEKRDVELRKRLQESEHKLGLSMPIEDAKERAAQLESQITLLDRRLILASGMEGVDGFRQRWSLHGRLSDTKMRLESLKQGIENRKKDEQPISTLTPSTRKKWFFF